MQKLHAQLPNKNGELFKGRFIDTGQLESVIKFIDWKNLIKELNPFK